MKIMTMVAMMVAATAWAQPGAIGETHGQQVTPSAKIIIHVADYAQFGDSTLRRAATIVSGIFRKVDADVTVALHPDAGADLEESALPQLCHLQVLILPQKMAKQLGGWLRLSIMGIAPSVSPNCVLVYLFSQPMMQLIREQRYPDTGMLLGYVIAHEIGHLLLHRASHSQTGIMRSKWDSDYLLQMARGVLSFCPQEAAEIRMEIVRRHSGQVPTELAGAMGTSH